MREEYASEYLTKALAANGLTRTPTRCFPRFLVRCSLSTWSRLRTSTARSTSPMAAPARATTRFASKPPSRPSTRSLRFSLPFAIRELHTREEEIDWAAEHGVPVKASKASPYSIDDNVWGRAIECGALENPWNEPPADIWTLSVDPENAPNEAEYVEIGFEKGVPCSLNGEEKSFLQIVMDLNVLAGKHGCGRIDMVENRLVGVKSRECYETPAAEVLIAAHKALETLCLDRETQHFKLNLEHQWSTTVYYGQWFSPLKNALDAFFAENQKFVTGTVKVKLYKGSCTVAGRMSDHSLYDYGLASYTAADTFDHEAAKGFIDLSALPFAVWAEKQGHEAQDL